MSDVPQSGSTTYERMELATLRAHAADLIAASAHIGRALIPYYEERNSLRDKIACTHETRFFDGRRCVVRLVRENAPQRAPLFVALDLLNGKWAPQVNEQRILKAQLRETNSQIKKLADWIAKQHARRH